MLRFVKVFIGKFNVRVNCFVLLLVLLFCMGILEFWFLGVRVEFDFWVLFVGVFIFVRFMFLILYWWFFNRWLSIVVFDVGVVLFF